MSAHPDEDTLELAVLERLPGREMERLAGHIAECPECQIQIDKIRLFVAALRAALIESPSDPRCRPGWITRALSFARRSVERLAKR